MRTHPVAMKDSRLPTSVGIAMVRLKGMLSGCWDARLTSGTARLYVWVSR